MSAFIEVMTAEQEADKAIALAKEEVAAAIHAAEADRRTRLTATEAELRQAEQTEQAKHERQVADVVKKIESDAEAQVVAIKQRFATHKTELTDLLKNRFNK